MALCRQPCAHWGCGFRGAHFAASDARVFVDPVCACIISTFQFVNGISTALHHAVQQALLCHTLMPEHRGKVPKAMPLV